MQNKFHTPRKVLNLLLRFMDLEERENFTSYMDSVYREILFDRGPEAARSWFRDQFIRSFPRLVKKSLEGDIIMIFNHFKVAIRCIKKHKIYSFINITGLAIGIAAAFLILLWVDDERSYDQFHANAGRIYRAAQVFHYDNHHLETADTPAILAPTIVEECPEVELATRIRAYHDDYLVIADGKQFDESGLGIADSAFFTLFSFPLVEGNPKTILSEPHTAAISESAAEKYFGGPSAFGRTLRIFDEDFL